MLFLPYARLLRLPNVFTAFADIALGACVATSFGTEKYDGERVLVAAILLAFASGCLYLAGTVWNDYFDLEEDTRDRPFRPLPSKQVSLRTAAVIGVVLFVFGLGFAVLSGIQKDGFRPDAVIIAAILAA